MSPWWGFVVCWWFGLFPARLGFELVQTFLDDGPLAQTLQTRK